MRVYDPKDDLPPAGVEVYALLHFSSEFSGITGTRHANVSFDPQIGWISEDYRNFRVIKWSDLKYPDLSKYVNEEMQVTQQGKQWEE